MVIFQILASMSHLDRNRSPLAQPTHAAQLLLQYVDSTLIPTPTTPSLPYLPITSSSTLDVSTHQDPSAPSDSTRSSFFDDLASKADNDKRIDHFKDYLSGYSINIDQADAFKSR